MIWTRPTMNLIKMDAEIGSYQEDPDPSPRSSQWVRNHRATTDPVDAAPRALVGAPSSCASVGSSHG